MAAELPFTVTIMPGPLSPEEDAERRRLHAVGLSDAEIAAQRGLSSTSAIRTWRTKNGLPSNSPRAPRGEVLLMVLALWHEGFTDREMEPIIGHLPTQERKRLGLPPNTKCRTCHTPIEPNRWYCDEHLARDDEKNQRYFVARSVLWNLAQCIGDDYVHARDLALGEFPWLADSIERWESEGRIGPVPTRKNNAPLRSA